MWVHDLGQLTQSLGPCSSSLRRGDGPSGSLLPSGASGITLSAVGEGDGQRAWGGLLQLRHLLLGCSALDHSSCAVGLARAAAMSQAPRTPSWGRAGLLRPVSPSTHLLPLEKKCSCFSHPWKLRGLLQVSSVRTGGICQVCCVSDTMLSTWCHLIVTRTL